MFAKKMIQTLQKISFCTLLLFYLFNCNTLAQNSDFGSWNICNLRYNYNDNISLFGEVQLRSWKFYDNFFYYEAKGGITYMIHSNAKISLAAGKYLTYPETGNFISPIKNNETRIWGQFAHQQTLWKENLEHRYRIEARFTSKGYRNRFRYRLGLTLPLLKNQEGKNYLSLNMSDEVFFSNLEPYFEKNRASFFFLLSKHIISYQIGYMHQFDYSLTKQTPHDFLMAGIMFELRKKEKAVFLDLNYD